MSDNRINKNQPVGDELHEECGVFGMYDFDGGDVASTIYYGLFALQHRGQESCGIAVSETNGPPQYFFKLFTIPACLVTVSRLARRKARLKEQSVLLHNSPEK